MTEIKIILAAYFLILLGIGIYSYLRVKSASDYFVAGKRGSWWQVSGSLFATIIGASAILGTIELSQRAGWAALWFLGSASAGLFVLAFLTSRISRLGNYTLPELLGYFYGKKAQKLATILIPVAWLGVVAAQVIGGAKILSSIGLFTYTQGALLAGVVFILYTLIGGQLSILKTDFFQSLVILAGLFTLFFIRFRQLSPADIPPITGSSLLNDRFGPLDLFFLLITYSITFVVGPDIYTRIFCARNQKIARLSVVVVAILILPVAFMLTFLGITAAPGEASAASSQFVLPGTSFLPPWALGLLIAALLSAVMSSASTTLLTSSMIVAELFTGNLNQKRSLLLTRWFVVLLGFLSLLIAIQVTSVLKALLIALSFFSGAFILPMIAGLARWPVNSKMVLPAILTGGFMALAGRIVSEFVSGNWGYFLISAAFILNAVLLLFRAPSPRNAPKFSQD